MSNDLEYIKEFQNRVLPEEAILVGYAALIKKYNLQLPLPYKLSAIGKKHKIYEKNNWRIFSPRYLSEDSVEDNFIFALKYEGLDLLVLKKIFELIDKDIIIKFIKLKPTSSYIRRIWFLYEWLMDCHLPIKNINIGNYVDIVDTKLQYGASRIKEPRYKIYNNLPGTREFCPLVFKTSLIDKYINMNLYKKADKVVSKIPVNILRRTISFLLLKDSKSSYVIEGEGGAQDRIRRWGSTLSDAGKNYLNIEELLRLQNIILGKAKFVKFGLRKKGGFVGIHDPYLRIPVPEHISAKAQDLLNLLQGLFIFEQEIAGKLDPIMSAAILSFGFIYIHPFEDGNGRLHRYLIHHILKKHGFNNINIIFPVSSVILEKIKDYIHVLESYSQRILPFIKWRATSSMNVEVLNETIDFYRYFDATLHVEFLYSCIEQVINYDIPKEVKFLEKYDLFKTKIDAFIEMPVQILDLLFNFLKQGGGKLSKRALKKEFKFLSEEEIKYIEKSYKETF